MSKRSRDRKAAREAKRNGGLSPAGRAKAKRMLREMREKRARWERLD